MEVRLVGRTIRVQKTGDGLEQQVANLTRSLTEALEQQTATSELLKVIGRSRFDLQAVFQTLAENAVRLCGAEYASIWRFDGQLLRAVVTPKVSIERKAFIDRNPIAPGRYSATGRAGLERKAIHIHDAQSDPELTYGSYRLPTDPTRTVLAIPMLKDQRTLVMPFTDGQIALMETFADQAVIAIENVRLFDEIQDESQQLEITNSYKSRFLAGASHDLRQPLHALNPFVAQLSSEPNQAERGHLIARIGAAVSSMNELFDALLETKCHRLTLGRPLRLPLIARVGSCTERPIPFG